MDSRSLSMAIYPSNRLSVSVLCVLSNVVPAPNINHRYASKPHIAIDNSWRLLLRRVHPTLA